MERILPQSFQKEPTLSTPWFQASRGNKFLLFKATQCVVICYNGHRKLMQLLCNKQEWIHTTTWSDFKMIHWVEETTPKKPKNKKTHTCMVLFIYNSRKRKLVYLDKKVTHSRGGAGGSESKGIGHTVFTILTMILSWVYTCQHLDFPGSSDGKESACKAGD